MLSRVSQSWTFRTPMFSADSTLTFLMGGDTNTRIQRSDGQRAASYPFFSLPLFGMTQANLIVPSVQEDLPFSIVRRGGERATTSSRSSLLLVYERTDVSR